VCAIHQPNLFPRLSTLAKLYAADRWIVLDSVQFARRDYQHRTRLAALDDPDRQQWLTLPTHLPQGRSTLISQARLADTRRTRRTVELLVRQYYGRSHHWPTIRPSLDTVLDRVDITDRVADIAETSVRVLFAALGWKGKVLHSSVLPTRPGRSERLADLTALTGGTHYLCGPGGLRYLDAHPFKVLGIRVVPFHTPVETGPPPWNQARRITALWALATLGPTALTERLTAPWFQRRPAAGSPPKPGELQATAAA
jgi:hypothetical protein